MTHKQIQTDRRIRSAFTAGVALLLIGVLLGPGRVPVAQGYNADATTAITGLTQHSSFHYEMVRVLALLAGFDKNEAEEIGVAGEAVDLGQFTGYKFLGSKAKTVTIRNTNRFGPNGRLYHFGRRSSQYEKVDADGARSNTCEYFKGGDRTSPNTAPCTVKGPELDQIKNWAFDLPGPKPTANELPRDASGKPIQPKTPVAIGIYVHSIGDSYSHEKCMIDAAFRFHKPIPFSCNTQWHTDPVRGEFTVGIAFTKAAANEVWRALRQFKGADGSNPPNFIKEFLAIKDACTRVKFAVDTFNSLTGETSKGIRCPGPSGTLGKSRRRG
ncbi:MAG: hypothetical protein H7Z16_05335 [Pyrinomonadaceae bacterium]|nr:hypothetical protein [Pyrinomonadaceae bacterium]